MAAIVTGRGKRQRFAVSIKAALSDWCEQPFVWGRSDCLLSLADIVAEARGYDPAAPFRGRYTTARGAARVTSAYGGFAGALEAMAAAHGWREIEPRQARIGDVGLLQGARGPRCGVIRHERLWVGRTLTAFAGVRTELVARAWRVT